MSTDLSSRPLIHPLTHLMNDTTLNVLFLGGAKRVSLAGKLMDAARERGVTLNIFSYELTPEVPIACVAKVIIGRRWADPAILEDIHRCVRQHRINLILPFVDPAVGIAGRYADTYGDVWAPVVPQAMAEVLFDKGLAAVAFKEAKLPIPRTYNAGRPNFPLLAKPRRGSASQGIFLVNDIATFKRVRNMTDTYIMEEYVGEREEYTVDCYICADGTPLYVSPRRRLEVLGGEVSRTVTVDHPDLAALSRKVIAALGLRGAVTLQFMYDLAASRLLLMEINPRLGGGVVCSIHAGADIPGAIIDEAMHRPHTPRTEIRPGTLICRYFAEVPFFNSQA